MKGQKAAKETAAQLRTCGASSALGLGACVCAPVGGTLAGFVRLAQLDGVSRLLEQRQLHRAYELHRGSTALLSASTVSSTMWWCVSTRVHDLSACMQVACGALHERMAGVC